MHVSRYPPHYPPFGSKRPNRTWSDANRGYRFGFNNQEQESGLENSSSFNFRMYDSRLIRFYSLDPLKSIYPYVSSYVFAENDVIRSIDLEGLEKYIITFRSFIPDAKIENPNVLGTSDYFKGDNRQYYDVNATSFRTEMKVSVDFDKGKATALSNVASPSVGIDNKDKVVETSNSSIAGTISNTLGFNENSEAITFYFRVEASNSLVTGAPSINADLAVTITPNADGCSYDYNIKGVVDGFPAYEIFVTDVSNGINESNLIFNQNPIEANQGPWSLWGSGEFKYNYSSNSNTESLSTKKTEKANFKQVHNTPENE